MRFLKMTPKVILGVMCVRTPPQHTCHMYMHAYIQIQMKKANHIDAPVFAEDLSPVAPQDFGESREIAPVG